MQSKIEKHPKVYSHEYFEERYAQWDDMERDERLELHAEEIEYLISKTSDYDSKKEIWICEQQEDGEMVPFQTWNNTMDRDDDYKVNVLCYKEGYDDIIATSADYGDDLSMELFGWGGPNDPIYKHGDLWDYVDTVVNTFESWYNDCHLSEDEEPVALYTLVK